jgi:hypothetical protein
MMMYTFSLSSNTSSKRTTCLWLSPRWILISVWSCGLQGRIISETWDWGGGRSSVTQAERIWRCFLSSCVHTCATVPQITPLTHSPYESFAFSLQKPTIAHCTPTPPSSSALPPPCITTFMPPLASKPKTPTFLTLALCRCLVKDAFATTLQAHSSLVSVSIRR